MEGFFYLLDVVFVIWLLVMVRRNDNNPEAMKTGELGIFSMSQQIETQSNGKGARNKKMHGKF